MTLIESVNRDIQSRKTWLKDMELAQEMALTLPKSLQELEGSIDTSGGIATMNFFGGTVAMEVCKKAGVVFNKPVIGSSSGKFNAQGILPEDTIVHVYDIPTPVDCIVTKTTRTITEYEAVCTKKEAQ